MVCPMGQYSKVVVFLLKPVVVRVAGRARNGLAGRTVIRSVNGVAGRIADRTGSVDSLSDRTVFEGGGVLAQTRCVRIAERARDVLSGRTEIAVGAVVGQARGITNIASVVGHGGDIARWDRRIPRSRPCRSHCRSDSSTPSYRCGCIRWDNCSGTVRYYRCRSCNLPPGKHRSWSYRRSRFRPRMNWYSYTGPR